MRKIKEFAEFMLDALLESHHNVKELPLLLSDRLVKLLQGIDHEIARGLLEANERRVDKPLTFVDVDKKDFGKFTAVYSNKAFDSIYDTFSHRVTVDKETLSKEIRKITSTSQLEQQGYWKRYRTSIRIGRFIGKVFPGKYPPSGRPGEDIDTFTSAVISERKKQETAWLENFELASGKDIVKFYDEDRYVFPGIPEDEIDSTDLGKSCMRHGYCGSYLEFYADNNVRLLVLHPDGDKEKIIGRAIVWELSEPSGRTFMDRIYYEKPKDRDLFQKYAEEKGWLMKKMQDNNPDAIIIDGKTKESRRMLLKTTKDFKPASNGRYPYLDTMIYFVVDKGYLTNDETVLDTEDVVYVLRGVDGGYDIGGLHGDDDDMVWCELGQESLPADDAIWIEAEQEYATPQYVEHNMIFSQYNDGYIRLNSSIYSEYYDDYFEPDQVVQIYCCDGEDAAHITPCMDTYLTDDDASTKAIGYMVTRDGIKMMLFFLKKECENMFVWAYDDSTGHYRFAHKVWDEDRLKMVDGEWHITKDKQSNK